MIELLSSMYFSISFEDLLSYASEYEETLGVLQDYQDAE